MLDLVPEIEKLAIITYPHPTLRYTAKPVRRVDAELRRIVQRMIQLMYEHKGVGLAATQVNLPLRVFVFNPKGNPDEGPESVFINPVVSRPRSNEEAEEGCLSLPGIYGNVIRAKTVRVNAFDISGREINQDFSGYEARIIQHETDHLNGTLFIDRMKDSAMREKQHEIESLVTDFESRKRTGSLPPESAMRDGLKKWEQRYC